MPYPIVRHPLPLVLITGALAAAPLVAAPPTVPAPTGLMCDLLAQPDRTEITNPRPRFSWIVNGAGKDQAQTAYELRVTERPSPRGKPQPLWDSGRKSGDRSTAVPYEGPVLRSHATYWWSVRTWDRQGRLSPWSAAQRIRTGELRGSGTPNGDERINVARYPVEQTAVAPVRVKRLAEGHYFLDFGRAAYGGLQVTADSPEEGTRLVVHLGEALEGPERVQRKPGGSIRYLRAELVLQKGRHTYAVPLPAKDARRMPPSIGPVMPFRYVELENYPGTADRESARQLAAHYPFDEGAARFLSSDPGLNAVWELCRYSMKATSPFGVYVDGDRERLPYEADAYINQLGHYCTDREYTLARYSLQYLMLHPTWPTEWHLHMPLMAWEDYLYTGDRGTLDAFYPDLKRKTLRELARADGLVSTVQPALSRAILASLGTNRLQDIVDWPAGERDGYDMRPVNTVVNAFHYRSLVLMARLAEAHGQAADAADLRAAAERVRRSFQSAFWSPETGLYVDGEGSRHSSLHANMCALAFGLVPPERTAGVAAFVRSKGMACSVYGAQYLLDALYEAGEGDAALKLVTATNDRGWLHMVRDVGSTVTLEAWDNRYKPNQDWNHAWGAAPANIIPRRLMGITPLEAGFRRMRIHPQPGSLPWARLDLPTIRGTVHEEFRSTPTRFEVKVTLPANTSAEVWLPHLKGQGADVLVDGKVQRARVDGTWLVLDRVGSGEHTLVRQVLASK